MKAQSNQTLGIWVQDSTLIGVQVSWWLSDVIVVLVADSLVVIHCCGRCSGCLDRYSCLSGSNYGCSVTWVVAVVMCRFPLSMSFFTRSAHPIEQLKSRRILGKQGYLYIYIYICDRP